ncbi:MAG: GNAT family N-acetyltransferase, partial [Pseudomonadota bacterium]
FVGTTVSEYALFPPHVSARSVANECLAVLIKEKLPLMIFKDLPVDSPLLSEQENLWSQNLMGELKALGFEILSGEALAYVPINFKTVEDYLNRLSKSRKKDLKRKLKSLAKIDVQEVDTGDVFFTQENIDYLYQLYLNVYNASYIHFDLMSREFFQKIFQDSHCPGKVFLYRVKGQEKIIAFNLCFIHENNLVDKYVGFKYPESQNYNLYFVSWFYNLDYCLRNKLNNFIAGWTDPEVKAYLGAQHTMTYHAAYVKNSLWRFILKKLKSFFEADAHILEKLKAGKNLP